MSKAPIFSLPFDSGTYQMILPNSDTDYIQGTIASAKQPYELEMLEDMRRRMKGGDLVVDVGANVGNHAVYMAAAGARVIAVEPNNQLAEAIKASAELNGWADRLSVLAIGLGQTEGRAGFAAENPANLGGMSLVQGDGPIRIRTLDTILDGDRPSIIKIDVEGMEMEVLKGAATTIENCQPLIYVECLGQAEFRAVAGWLEDRGYSYWDTFNASPTHLFVPKGYADSAQRSARALFKEALDQYIVRDELKVARDRLNEANKKYRDLAESYAKVKAQVAQYQADYQHAAQGMKGLESRIQSMMLEAEGKHHAVHALEISQADTKARLEAANLKYRDISEHHAKLLATIESIKAARQEADLSVTRHKMEIATLKERLELTEQSYKTSNSNQAELQARLQDFSAARQAAEIKAAKNEADVAALKDLLKDADRRYNEASSQQGELLAKLDKVTSAKHEADIALARQEANVAALKDRLVAVEQKYSEQFDSYAELKAQFTEQSSSLRSELTKVVGERDLLLARYNDAQTSLEKAAAELANIRTESALVRTEHTRTTQNLITAQEMQKTLEAEINEERKRYAFLGEEYSALQENLAASQQELRLLATQYDELTQQQIALQSKAKDEANSAAAALAEARAALEHKSAELDLAYENAAILRSSLNTANQKYRESAERYNALRDKAAADAETARTQQRTLTTKYESLKQESLKNKQALSRAEAAIARLTQEKLDARNQVAKTRAMISFQLGYAILQALKSPKAFFLLPLVLWRIIKDARRRRNGGAPQSQRNSTAALPAPNTAQGVAPIQSKLSVATTLPVMMANEQRTIVAAAKDSAITPSILKALKVACIMDEFTYGSYKQECNLLQLTPSGWRDEITAFNPELVLIESAWRGKDELWGNKVGHQSQEVRELLGWAHDNGIPTAFWNKEDPVHFETFLNTARLFDHVFTTDIDCIHRYKAALGHERVYLLPFAAQPEINNPIEKFERKDAFCFAGAYYVRYPDRTRDLGNFVSELSSHRPVEIYDRNFGKDDPNYQFPEEYKPYIVGNLPYDQIDKAYKGYRFAINLNSIKQSQTMFARRVYELLASGTITVSNFSRGVRLMFGDLVVTTDSGIEAVKRIKAIDEDESHSRKLKLAALRKIMREHTYQDRLAYVVSKAKGVMTPDLLPHVAVVGYAKDMDQLNALQASFQRQSYQNKKLFVVVPSGFDAGVPEREDTQFIAASMLQDQTVAQWLEGWSWIAAMVVNDYYGKNYLQDLILATRYSSATAIGKQTHFVRMPDGEMIMAFRNQQYRAQRLLPVRSSLTNTSLLSGAPARDWVIRLETNQVDTGSQHGGLSIDEFNYCKNGGWDLDSTQARQVNDLEHLNEGISLKELIRRAEAIQPAETTDSDEPAWAGDHLSTLFAEPKHGMIKLRAQQKSLCIESSLVDRKQEYLYANADFTPEQLGWNDHALFHLDVTPGLNVQLTLLFLDAQKQRISHVVKGANRNHEVPIPMGTKWIRLGLRIYAAGTAEVRGLVLAHRALRPAEVIGRAEHLVLTNHYPSYDDLYRNGFVHSRVIAYKERDVCVDIFRLRTDEALSYHEYQDVDCITGSTEALHKLLAQGCYKSVLVHFLDAEMWQVLQHYVDRTRIVVWVHGSEVQPWHRRDYNFTSEHERDTAKVQSEVRMRFWRELFADLPDGLRFVFVSRYFAEEVMEDVGIRLPESSYEVIHNPIDTDCFAYHPKPAEQRMRILSIRPYASRKYANDLSVGAILELSKKPYFKDLEFRMIGDGKLFDETLEPIKGFENVVIERRFLSHNEIGALHKDYGIFLCPTRMDAQGVSRDEAMSSGLVPVTNGVTAIPEFVDSSCGILAGPDDAEGMANGIAMLIEQPETFMRMSAAAAARVRQQSPVNLVASQEIAAFLHAHP